MRPPLLRAVCGALVCALVLALVARAVAPFVEPFQTRPPDPIQAGHEWADSDVDPVAAAGEHSILLTNVGPRGEFNADTDDGVGRGEFRASAAEEFPHLLFSPVMMAATWCSLFGTVRPLDLDRYRAAHERA